MLISTDWLSQRLLLWLTENDHKCQKKGEYFILFMLKYYFNFYSINIEWNIIQPWLLLKYLGFYFIIIIIKQLLLFLEFNLF